MFQSSETGTASNGISVARQPCRKMNTTMITSTIASKKSVLDLLQAFVTASVVSRGIT